jgi:hypothetical protein
MGCGSPGSTTSGSVMGGSGASPGFSIGGGAGFRHLKHSLRDHEMAADASGRYRESVAFDCIERCFSIIRPNISVNAAPIEIGECVGVLIKIRRIGIEKATVFSTAF